ncbi:MAG: nucleotidyltransferase domain-containing protein [candidate division WOR-3 bacterium]|nr:nucleotidyltransferase domain-containing protein [candidate division WOR-3 bacterium]
MLDRKNIFISTAHQKVLEFLCEHPTSRFYDRELARSIKGVSLASVNNVLKDLAKVNFVKRKQEGRQVYSTLNLDHPLIRRFRVFLNFLNLLPFLEDLKKAVDKIIIYGSVTEGSNLEESDIDILVVSDRPFEVIQRVLEKHKMEEKVQLIVKTKAEYLGLKKKEPVFYEEVHRGMVYYE